MRAVPAVRARSAIIAINPVSRAELARRVLFTAAALWIALPFLGSTIGLGSVSFPPELVFASKLGCLAGAVVFLAAKVWLAERVILPKSTRPFPRWGIAAIPLLPIGWFATEDPLPFSIAYTIAVSAWIERRSGRSTLVHRPKLMLAMFLAGMFADGLVPAVLATEELLSTFAIFTPRRARGRALVRSNVPATLMLIAGVLSMIAADALRGIGMMAILLALERTLLDELRGDRWIRFTRMCAAGAISGVFSTQELVVCVPLGVVCVLSAKLIATAFAAQLR